MNGVSMITTPPEFSSICRALLIDPSILDRQGVSISEYAVPNVRSSDLPEIRRFIDELLSGAHTDSELKAWWDSLPVGFSFATSSGVVELLQAMKMEC
jgi:hypothetical protein